MASQGTATCGGASSQQAYNIPADLVADTTDWSSFVSAYTAIYNAAEAAACNNQKSGKDGATVFYVSGGSLHELDPKSSSLKSTCSSGGCVFAMSFLAIWRKEPNTFAGRAASECSEYGTLDSDIQKNQLKSDWLDRSCLNHLLGGIDEVKELFKLVDPSGVIVSNDEVIAKDCMAQPLQTIISLIAKYADSSRKTSSKLHVSTAGAPFTKGIKSFGKDYAEPYFNYFGLKAMVKTDGTGDDTAGAPGSGDWTDGVALMRGFGYRCNLKASTVTTFKDTWPDRKSVV